MVLSSAVTTNGERVLAAIWKSGSACGQMGAESKTCCTTSMWATRACAVDSALRYSKFWYQSKAHLSAFHVFHCKSICIYVHLQMGSNINSDLTMLYFLH